MGKEQDKKLKIRYKNIKKLSIYKHMFNLIFCMKINYFCGNLNSTQSQSTKPCNNDSRETDILKFYI